MSMPKRPLQHRFVQKSVRVPGLPDAVRSVLFARVGPKNALRNGVCEATSWNTMHAPGALRHKISGRPFDTKSPDGKTVTLTHRRKMARRAGIRLLSFLRGRMGSDKNHMQHDMKCDTIHRGNGYLQAGLLFRNAGANTTVSDTHAN